MSLSGTQAGDAGEMSSVLDTFAQSSSKLEVARRADQPLYLGSAKANIGHGEAASGVSSLIKVLLMMQKIDCLDYPLITPQVVLHQFGFPSAFFCPQITGSFLGISFLLLVHMK